MIGWSWIGAALFGVLIAATDPVSVIAAFREMGCLPRVSMVVEAESLLNDGVAAVGFAVLSAVAVGASPTPRALFRHSCGRSAAEWLVGLLVSAAILLIVGRTDDPLVEITLTTIAAYGSFLIAEHFHASGIISALDRGPADRQRRHAASFRTRAASACVGVGIFRVPRQQLRLHPDRDERRQPADASARVGRRGNRDPARARRTRACRSIRCRRCSAGRAGGCRRVPAHFVLGRAARRAGACARARGPGEVPERNAIILTAFVVVAFSILVQGLTMPWLIRRLRTRRKGRQEAVAAPQR